MITLQVVQDSISHAKDVPQLIEYTPLVLFMLGITGVLLHNLVQLNKINKATGGNANIIKYIKLEMYSIIISVIMAAGAVVISQEVKMLHDAGLGLGFGHIAIGYMGQSLLVFVMGKAEKTINKND